MPDWKSYAEQTKNKPPRPLLVDAISYVKNTHSALDMGSGALNDTIYLLDKDWRHVIALDKENVASDIANSLPKERFEYIIDSFETYPFPKNQFDLINVQYALPFIHPDKFNDVFKSIMSALRPEGVFVGQLFGNRDEWNTNSAMTFHTREEAETLFRQIEVIRFHEEERDGVTAAGKPKHWHIFHFIARKPIKI